MLAHRLLLDGLPEPTHLFRNSIIERIALKAPLYSIRVSYVNPRGTTNSTKHDETMRKYGLDKHTTSAYLTALKGLNTNKYG